MIRVCPKRDGRCPHGMECPYTIDRYSCKPEPEAMTTDNETDAKRVPNPGSSEAIAQGCRCPVLDNAHGKGYMGQLGIFVYVEGCPVHDTGRSETSKETAP